MIADAARDLVRRSTRASGVPLLVEDAATLERVATLLHLNANKPAAQAGPSLIVIPAHKGTSSRS